MQPAAVPPALLAIAIALPLAACGGGADTASGQAATTATTTAASSRATSTATTTAATTAATGAGAATATATGSTAAAPTAVRLGTGARMCDALTARDLRAAGLRPEREVPEPNADGDTGAYCAFTKASGAKGGIEFDIFDGGQDVQEVWETVSAEGSGIEPELTPVRLPGADEARIGSSLRYESGPRFGAIQVRKGRMVFALSIPAGSRTREQLVDLATLVLRRVQQ